MEENDRGAIVVQNIQNEVKRRFLILEPPILLLYFSWNLTGAVLTNQILYQSCTVALGYNVSSCKLLGTENETEEIIELEAKTQPYATNILMAKSLLGAIVPAFLSLFIGPWSDKFGRKPVMLCTFFAFFLNHVLVAWICLLSTFYAINPWYYVLAFVPASLVGGNCALNTVVFCYVTDVTDEHNRAFKLAVLEAAMFVGLLLGSLSSSFILSWTSSTIVFTISAALIFLGGVYVVFFVKESVRISELENTNHKFRELFRLELVSEMYQTCTQRRPNYDRAMIWLIILNTVACIFAIQGSANVFFLFVREKFEWTVKEFSYYDSTNTVAMTVGNFVGIYGLKKLCGVSDIVLAVVSIAFLSVDGTIKAFATMPWHLYIATGITLLKGVEGPASMAVLSNMVPANDMGKIYAMAMSLETITPLGSSPLYTFIYKLTLRTFIGAFNLISTAMFTIALILITLVYILKKFEVTSTYISINS